MIQIFLGLHGLYFQLPKKVWFIFSLPNVKILDWSKLKALGDDKINVIQSLRFFFFFLGGGGIVENILEKGENAGYQCWLPVFSPFPLMFSKASFLRVIKIQDCVVKS